MLTLGSRQCTLGLARQQYPRPSLIGRISSSKRRTAQATDLSTPVLCLNQLEPPPSKVEVLTHSRLNMGQGKLATSKYSSHTFLLQKPGVNQKRPIGSLMLI
jgi:hypothetical protein